MHPTVFEILQARRRVGGTPPFDDPYRIALVAEGGAMRGVVAGGMVSAIEEHGFTDCFDFMIGTSAGACALAYLRASQARLGTRIFYEDINNKSFIDLTRPLRGRTIVDIDFLIDQVFRKVKPLDQRRFAEPGAELLAVATDIASGEGVALGGFDIHRRAYEILRATARMPLLAAGPVEIDGRRFIDGGVAERVPLSHAIGRGATHILAILTRSPNAIAVTQPPSIAEHGKNVLIGAVYNWRLRSLARNEALNYRAIYGLLAGGKNYRRDSIQMRAVTPAAGFPDISRMETDAAVLRNAADHSMERMSRFLTTDKM